MPYSPSDEDAEIIRLWLERYKRAKESKDPIRKKHLRKYELYRGYRRKSNYAYDTSLMPPIAFKVVRTIVSRLANQNIDVNIYAGDKTDLADDVLDRWKQLANHALDIDDIDSKIITHMWNAATFGNGVLMPQWDYRTEEPVTTDLDLWDLLPAPETVTWETMPWLIQRIVRPKEQVDYEEQQRGENRIYNNYDLLSGGDFEDWKKERYEINTLKMASIDHATKPLEDERTTASGMLDKNEPGKNVEFLYCHDFVKKRLVVIGNQAILNRNEVHPYADVNHARIFLSTPAHEIPNEPWADGYLDPIETTIHEIADNRNHRMDSIVFSLDPILKIKKGHEYSPKDFEFGPGQVWQLTDPELDVIIERPRELSQDNVQNESMLMQEAEETVGVIDYMQGTPQSSSEPTSKVALLLGQSNQGMSLPIKNLRKTLNTLVSIYIQMYKKWLTSDKLYRLTGEDDFKSFHMSDKEVSIDAEVDIEAVVPKDRNQRVAELQLLWQMLIEPGPVGGGEDPEQVAIWADRKGKTEKLIVEELGDERYLEILDPPERLPAEAAPQAPAEIPPQAAGPPPEGSPEQQPSTQQPTQEQVDLAKAQIQQEVDSGQGRIGKLLQKIPLINRLFQ